MTISFSCIVMMGGMMGKFLASPQSLARQALLADSIDAIPHPDEITAEEALTETQKAIRTKIHEADDSYRVRFFTPVRVKVPVTIHAIISTAFVAADARKQIIDAVLFQFGEEAAAARRGGNRVLYQSVYKLLREKVPALQSGEADLLVSIADLPEGTRQTPEMWRFVAPDSLDVTVENLTAIVNPVWR
jgi:hypothetical protein